MGCSEGPELLQETVGRDPARGSPQPPLGGDHQSRAGVCSWPLPSLLRTTPGMSFSERCPLSATHFEGQPPPHLLSKRPRAAVTNDHTLGGLEQEDPSPATPLSSFLQILSPDLGRDPHSSPPPPPVQSSERSSARSRGRSPGWGAGLAPWGPPPSQVRSPLRGGWLRELPGNFQLHCRGGVGGRATSTLAQCLPVEPACPSTLLPGAGSKPGRRAWAGGGLTWPTGFLSHMWAPSASQASDAEAESRAGSGA